MKSIQEAYKEYESPQLMGKKVIITGGTTGIGRAIALLLASLGNEVFITGRHQQELSDTLADHDKSGGKGSVQGITADLSRPEEVERFFDEADKQMGFPDILINNAALGFGGIDDGDARDWEYIVKTNLLSYMSCARQAVDRMKKSGEGHIINIGSMSAEDEGKNSSIYSATKAAVRAFTGALRKEVNEFGIRVNLVEPGKVGTDMQPESPEQQREQQEELEMLKAEDIAMAVRYMLQCPKRCDVIILQVMPFKQMLGA